MCIRDRYYAGRAEESVVAMSRKMAEQVDVPYMVRSTVATGGAYNYAAHTLSLIHI